MKNSRCKSSYFSLLNVGLLALGSGFASADQSVSDDFNVVGSVCAGFDFANGEAFGFDTLRLKENNVRIRFVVALIGTGASATAKRTSSCAG